MSSIIFAVHHVGRPLALYKEHCSKTNSLHHVAPWKKYCDLLKIPEIFILNTVRQKRVGDIKQPHCYRLKLI